MIHFNLFSHLHLPRGLVSSGASTNVTYTPVFYAIRATSQAHLIPGDFVTLSMFAEKYESSSTWQFCFVFCYSILSLIRLVKITVQQAIFLTDWYMEMKTRHSFETSEYLTHQHNVTPHKTWIPVHTAVRTPNLSRNTWRKGSLSYHRD
jgi:hypothetical protein